MVQALALAVRLVLRPLLSFYQAKSQHLHQQAVVQALALALVLAVLLVFVVAAEEAAAAAVLGAPFPDFHHLAAHLVRQRRYL